MRGSLATADFTTDFTVLKTFGHVLEQKFFERVAEEVLVRRSNTANVTIADDEEKVEERIGESAILK